MDQSSEPEPVPSTSSSEGATAASDAPSPPKEIAPSTLTEPATVPGDELQHLYTEMDTLNK